MKYFKNLVRW